MGSLVLAWLVTAAAAVANRTDSPTGDLKAASDRNITRVVADLLEHSQFSHHQLDDELAARFLDRYLDSLDPNHLLFLESDTKEFDTFRARLPDLTRLEGDSTPARVIFRRFAERLEQGVAYVTNLLNTETFDFTGHDSYSFDRGNAPRPKDLDDARQLWRQSIRAEYLQLKLAGKEPAEIVPTLTRHYLRLLRTSANRSAEHVLGEYLNALAQVHDPHSQYLDGEQLDSFCDSMNLCLFGIGATFREDDGHCLISELTPGGAAARSGLLNPGDRIVAIGEAEQEPIDVVGLPLTAAEKLLQGPKGTLVRLTLIPAGIAETTRKTVSIKREEVKLEDQQAKARIVDLPQSGGGTLRLGVVDLPSFYGSVGRKGGAKASSATTDVSKLIKKLAAEHIHGLILDLRENGGGSLNEAISLTGLFIRKGPVVQTRESNGQTDIRSHTDVTELYDGPLIVLTSRFSASASEIVAGALQDYGRALIVGDKSTYGKGTVQSVVPLAEVLDRRHLAHSNNPGALKVTIRKFYLPSGASTQLKGVASDIVLPSLSDAARVGEAEQKDPLPWDCLPTSIFLREDKVSAFLPELRIRSAARVSQAEDFLYLKSEIAQLKLRLTKKVVSLNESDRRHDIEVPDSNKESRARKVAAGKERQPTTYLITVKNSTNPGLPSPAVVLQTPEASPLASTNCGVDQFLAKGPQTDPVLRETERILADYATMERRPTAMSAATH